MPPEAKADNITAVPLQVVIADPLLILTAVVGVTVKVVVPEVTVQDPEVTLTV